MPTDRNHVIIVNERDEELGTMEKMEAHEKGVLHRAFSIFLLDDNNKLLLQQRAEAKYHSGGLWTNTCCSHPMAGENTIQAAQRRLGEELGIEVSLQEAFNFTYIADVGNGLTEHEYDHVFIGRYNGACNPDPEEVMAYRYLSLPEVAEWIRREPAAFTEWMKIIFQRFMEYANQDVAS